MAGEDELVGYLKRVAEVTETEIAIISTGPDREHTMVLHNPFD